MSVKPSQPDLRDMLSELLGIGEGLSDWEIDFIESLRRWEGDFLERCWNKYCLGRKTVS